MKRFLTIFKHLSAYLLVLVILGFSTGCNHDKIEAKSKQSIIDSKDQITDAKWLELQHFADYSVLTIIKPYPGAKQGQEFVLSKNEPNLLEQHKNLPKIKVPLQKIITTSTTHIPMLERLEVIDRLIGFPHTDYISSSKTRQLIDNGNIKEVGDEMNLNTEVVLSLQPDAIIGMSMGNDNKMYRNFEKNNIPVVFNAEWLEETPLGRAEWIKFFGALFDKDKMAQQIFDDIKTEYKNTLAIAHQDSIIPTVMTGVMYKDQWHLAAGESYMAQLFKDANTRYLWHDSKGQASLVLSFESVLNKAQKSDYWIGCGQFTSFGQMKGINPHYTEFQSFKNEKVFTFSKQKGVNGGIIYFELSPLMPHIVLKDLVKATHPHLLPEYKPYFLERLD